MSSSIRDHYQQALQFQFILDIVGLRGHGFKPCVLTGKRQGFNLRLSLASRKGFRMLHPKQFAVNEAWIAFRLNSAPIRTEQDGDFNCIALMDAASCFILGSELFSATEAEPDRVQVRRLLESARSQKQQLPRTLFVPREDLTELLTREAIPQEIKVLQVPESDLLIFIGEARRGFAERFERTPRGKA